MGGEEMSSLLREDTVRVSELADRWECARTRRPSASPVSAERAVNNLTLMKILNGLLYRFVPVNSSILSFVKTYTVVPQIAHTYIRILTYRYMY